MDHQPRKRFGQNFLSDEHIIQRIVDQLKLTAEDTVIEIGPGLGAITLPMLQQLNALQVIEIDRDLIAKLAARNNQKLTIHSQDVLTVDWPGIAAGNKLRLVGNLPYNIGTPLLLRLAMQRQCIADIHVMLQKEVVDRLVAQSGTRAFGRLSVIMQSCFHITNLFDVPPSSFSPAPKVDSAVARLTPLHDGPDNDALDALSRTTRIAFANKRKTLRNNFKSHISVDKLQAIGIDPSARAETLSLSQFLSLSKMLN